MLCYNLFFLSLQLCPVANCSDYVENCARCGVGDSGVDCESCVDTVIIDISETDIIYADREITIMKLHL